MALLSTDQLAVVQGYTLNAGGIPPLDADSKLLMMAAQDGAIIGKDAFTIDRFLGWNAAVNKQQVDAANAANPFASTPCPISEAEFGRLAPELVLAVAGTPVRSLKKYGEPRANPKTGTFSGGRFSSGSFGYWIGGPVTMAIAGKSVKFNLTGQLVAVNSGKADEAVDAAQTGPTA